MFTSIQKLRAFVTIEFLFFKENMCVYLTKNSYRDEVLYLQNIIIKESFMTRSFLFTFKVFHNWIDLKPVARKLSGSSHPGITEYEALQGWILKFGKYRKNLFISVENFVDWISNQNPPWAAYQGFISGHLIVIDKHPGIILVVIVETWRRLFAKCVLRVMGPEATNACKDDHICARLKAGIYGSVHDVQYIWYTNLSTEDWEFLLVEAKHEFN